LHFPPCLHLSSRQRHSVLLLLVFPFPARVCRRFPFLGSGSLSLLHLPSFSRASPLRGRLSPFTPRGKSPVSSVGWPSDRAPNLLPFLSLVFDRLPFPARETARTVLQNFVRIYRFCVFFFLLTVPSSASSRCLRRRDVPALLSGSWLRLQLLPSLLAFCVSVGSLLHRPRARRPSRD